MSKYVKIGVVLVICIVLFILLRLFSGNDDRVFQKYNLIYHALGGIDGYEYTNSKEAFEFNYNQGGRVFEVDLVMTSDGKLVARHDWDINHYEMLGQSKDGIKDNEPLSLEKFKSMKIHDKYQAIDFRDIVELLVKYEDAYLVLDTKEYEKEEVYEAYRQIVDTCKDIDKSVLKRIVPQIYKREMYDCVTDVYKFDNVLYTLYMDWDVSDEDILSFAIENKLAGIVMSEPRVNKDFIDSLSNNRINTYVHTINDIDKAKNYLDMGVTGIYTDVIYPYQLEK